MRKVDVPGHLYADTVAHCGELLKEKYKRCKLTRSRPYKKNDNARAEERNHHKVRELIGYERIDNEQCVFLFNQVYRYHNLLTNFFVASTRIVSKQRNPVTGKTRKKYDKARTFEAIRHVTQ